MNLQQQMAAAYDSFPESWLNMSKEQFISKALATEDPTKNQNILDAMVERKHQIRKGERELARIQIALKDG